MERASGILLHITSLPSPYGIGTLGREAFRWIDFLEAAGQRYWQILPVGPTGYGDSPYQSYSTFAGNLYLIDLPLLEEQGLLTAEEYRFIDWGSDPAAVDFDLLRENREAVLRKAFGRFDRESEDFRRFLWEHASWLDDYALYTALKKEFGDRPWYEWDEGIKLRAPDALERYRSSLGEEICFQKFIQYEFFIQWSEVKRYAGEKGVRIIGDIPIYVAPDSADVWANRSLFELDETGYPTAVAGCPPDAFSSTGQLWGNPLYRWEEHRAQGYSWWIERIRAAVRRFDVVRLDHFRGFEAYYSIPFGDETAQNGCWKPGPGLDFFRAAESVLGRLPLIAEDLGFLTDSVRELLRDSGYPGMKVLQFAFSSHEESSYLPHNHIRNCVVYTGTHDNDTLRGWFSSLSEEDRTFCSDYLRLTEDEGIGWGILRAAWGSVSDTAIAQAQDFLDLGASCRMNTPSTVGGNWRWRALPGSFTPDLSEKIRKMTKLYGRLR